MTTQNEQPSYFFIGSRGFCGTRWLASALNLHPQIYATHSLGPHNKLREEYTDREILENSAESVRNHRKDPVVVLAQRAAAHQGTDLPQFLGNVHGYPLEQLVRHIRTYGGRLGRSRVANLVRHPVDWVASGTANWRHQSSFSIFARKAMIESLNRSGTLSHPHDLYDHVLDLSRRHDFDLMDWNNLAFVYCCETLRFISLDLELARRIKVPVFRMEAITQNPIELTVLIGYITGARIIPGEEFHRVVEQLGVRNSHRRERRTLEQTWDGWAEWQRELFRHCLALSKLGGSCAELRYDLSFVA